MAKAYFQKFSPEELPAQIGCFKVYGQGRPVIANPHWHPEIECHLVLSGPCTIQVAQKRYTAAPGDLFIVNQDQLHAIYSVGDAPCVYLVLIFDYDSVVGAQREPGVFCRDVLFNHPLNASCPAYPQLRRLLFALYREQRRPAPGQMLIKHGLVQQLCGLLVRSQGYTASGEAGQRLDRSRAMIESTFQLIQDRYDQPLSLTQAAQAANLSVPHFCRIFKATTGMTFNDYLNYFRVRKATLLLKEELTSQQVADQCGFGSYASMIRCFRKFIQVTPQQARKEF